MGLSLSESYRNNWTQRLKGVGGRGVRGCSTMLEGFLWENTNRPMAPGWDQWKKRGSGTHQIVFLISPPKSENVQSYRKQLQHSYKGKFFRSWSITLRVLSLDVVTGGRRTCFLAEKLLKVTLVCMLVCSC